jgi:hypothetical protein
LRDHAADIAVGLGLKGAGLGAEGIANVEILIELVGEARDAA